MKFNLVNPVLEDEDGGVSLATEPATSMIERVIDGVVYRMPSRLAQGIDQDALFKEAQQSIKDKTASNGTIRTKAYLIDEKASGEDGLTRFVASDEQEDRDRDDILQNGWELDNFKQSPVFLWAHNHRDVPAIGTIPDVKIKGPKGGKQLLIGVRFANAEVYPFAGLIKALYDDGILRAVSVGFMPKEVEVKVDEMGRYNGTRFVKQELLEVSAVNVPANPRALIENMITSAGQKGWGEERVDQLRAALMSSEKALTECESRCDLMKKELGAGGTAVVEEQQKTSPLRELSIKVKAEVEQNINSAVRTAGVTFQDWPVAPKDFEWNEQAAERRWTDHCRGRDGKIVFEQFVRGFLLQPEISTNGKDEISIEPKFLIVDVDKGREVVVPQAIFALAACLQGGRKSTCGDLTSEEAISAKNHLGWYYRKMKLDAPWDRDEKNAGALTEEEVVAFLDQFGLKEIVDIYNAELIKRGNAISELTHQVEIQKQKYEKAVELAYDLICHSEEEATNPVNVGGDHE